MHNAKCQQIISYKMIVSKLQRFYTSQLSSHLDEWTEVKQCSDKWKSLTCVVIRAAQTRFMTANLSGHASVCHTQVFCYTAVGICISQTQRDLLMEEILRSALFRSDQIKGLELLLMTSKWKGVGYKPQNFIFHFIGSLNIERVQIMHTWKIH